MQPKDSRLKFKLLKMMKIKSIDLGTPPKDKNILNRTTILKHNSHTAFITIKLTLTFKSTKTGF